MAARAVSQVSKSTFDGSGLLPELLRSRTISPQGKYCEIVASEVVVKVWRAMSRGRVVVAVWVLFGVTALAMFGWPGLTGAVSRACHGRSALDVGDRWT